MKCEGETPFASPPADIVSRTKQFDGREIEIIDGLPDRSSRASVETAGNGNREAATIAVVTRRASLPRMSSAPRPPACHRSRGRQGQALRVAAKSAAILDRHSTRWRSQTAVGAEEWLRRGQTKEWARRQVSCQDFVITIREGHHQFSWHKKQEQSRISPSDTVVVLMGSQRTSHRRRGGSYDPANKLRLPLPRFAGHPWRP